VLCLALPRYFGTGCAAGRGELREPSLTLAAWETGWPKTLPSDSSSLFGLSLADSKKLFSLQNKRELVCHGKPK